MTPEERIERAEREVIRLTGSGPGGQHDKHFRMTVPAEPDRDSDLVLMDGLAAGREALRALHPVSDATPDLAAALAILRAHHGTLGDDEHLDEAIHHLSHAVAIRKMDTLSSEPVPATPACICGRAAPVAGTCFDIDGAYWSGHGEPVPATGNPDGIDALIDAVNEVVYTFGRNRGRVTQHMEQSVAFMAEAADVVARQREGERG